MDLSNLQFSFKTSQQDAESPNSCAIRVYNLSAATLAAVTKDEYNRVILQAGYTTAFGVIFDGTIKQFRIGKVNATDTYLDILAAEGDLAYNFSLVNKTLAAGWTHVDALKEARAAMAGQGVVQEHIDEKGLLGGTVPNARGKVMWGLPRAALRQTTTSVGASWFIDKNTMVVLPLDGYLPGAALVLNSRTGLIGLPEQTAEGVMATCLLNPKLVLGGLVQIDNASVNQTIQQNPSAGPLAYNQWAGLQLLASVTADGFYRVFVIEHEGDTRGMAWHSHLTCLAVNPATKKVKPYG